MTVTGAIFDEMKKRGGLISYLKRHRALLQCITVRCTIWPGQAGQELLFFLGHHLISCPLKIYGQNRTDLIIAIDAAIDPFYLKTL